MPTLYFYYPANVDYMTLLNEYENTDEYEICRVQCEPYRYDPKFTKEYKKCLKNCGTRANNPDKPFAKLTLGAIGDPTVGIVFTEVREKRYTPSEMTKLDLLLVKQVETTKSRGDLEIVDITLQDMLNPHARLNGDTLCKKIGEMTNQTLSSVSYLVNGESNPRFVEAECIDIHSKIHLGEIISKKSENIMNLLDNIEYKSYCESRGKKTEEECEVVKPWMKSGEYEKPVSICKLNRGRVYNSCDVNEVQRDKIKAYLRQKINSCVSEMGCITGTTGEDRSQAKFMRRHTGKNFPRDKNTPTQICCKRSLKAVVKGGLRMDRIYKYVGNMSYEEQLRHINNSSMNEEEKRLFIQGVQDSHQIGNKLVANLNIDRPTQILMESFSIIVRNALMEQFEQFVKLNKVVNVKTDAEAEAKLTEITGSQAKTGRIMSLLKSAATGIVSAIWEVTKLLAKTIAYFAKKGFQLLTWMFHHPTTAMWLAYSALFLKKKCCEMVSLRIYGDPQIVEVGLFGKSADLLKTSADYTTEMAILIKKTFLAKTYDFLGSSSFSAYMSTISTLVETGILYVVALIPVYGVVISSTIKMSGGLGIVMQSVGALMGEAMYYGFTAVLIKESGQDLYAIITGTCIKPPQAMTQLTTVGIISEAKGLAQSAKETSTQVIDTTVGAASLAAEHASGFFTYIYGMLPGMLEPY